MTYRVTILVTKPFIEIDVKVALEYKDLIIKRNFQINVSEGGFAQPE